MRAKRAPHSSRALVKSLRDQLRERVDRFLGVRTGCDQRKLCPLAGGEHHEAENALAGHGLVPVPDGDLRDEAARRLDEPGSGARVQPELIDDLDVCGHGLRVDTRLPQEGHRRVRGGRDSASAGARRMCSRPYSTMKAARASSVMSWRAEMAFTMIGRLEPVTT